MPRMSDGDPCTIIDLCNVQRIFGESWMEETNQDHRGYSTKCRSHHREEDLKDHVKKAWRR